MIPPGCNIADGGKPVRKSKMDVVQRKEKKKINKKCGKLTKLKTKSMKCSSDRDAYKRKTSLSRVRIEYIKIAETMCETSIVH